MKSIVRLLLTMYMMSALAVASAQNPELNKAVESSVKSKIEKPAAIDRDITSKLNTITVSTIKISNITATGAWCTYTYKSEADVVQHGICVSKGPSPTIQNSKFFPKGDPGPEFGAEITGLSANIKYFVRAFAKNSSGTVFYGNELNFTTLTQKK